MNDDGSDMANRAIEVFRRCRDQSAALLDALSEEAAVGSTPWANALEPMVGCLHGARGIDRRLYEITDEAD